MKKDYKLPLAKMANTDLSRILKSDEIQKSLRPAKKRVLRAARKFNPIRNRSAYLRLNPFAAALKKNAIKLQQRRAKERAEALAKKRGVSTFFFVSCSSCR